MRHALKSLLRSSLRGHLARNVRRLIVKNRFLRYRETIDDTRYTSQHGQDGFLDSMVFCGKTGGVFVDVGAADGVEISNTAFFERHRAWTGVCIEPNPVFFALLSRNRQCRLLNYGVGPRNEMLPYLELPGDLAWGSGFLEFYAPESRFTRDKPSGSRVSLLPMRRLMDVLVEERLSRIDYLSVDVEGPDFAVLKDLDFETIHVSALSVENVSHDEEVMTFLEGRGFRLLAVLGNDEIYGRRTAVLPRLGPSMQRDLEG